ncbi:uncharacterized protein LOC121390022 [Gigantopelta aegis]|uniref:uncharacterized protein LOC121390022 n=1 Tax=Gigantopelta aegis TaxID=1735272 RepID=UPI001B889C3D|nr:uncharacterized protein LOC121390022 [Gigantopelta aegis]
MGSGNNKLEFNTFNTIKRKSNKTYLNVSASVTEKCIPLSEAFFGTVSGQRIVETIRYYDVRVGIKDPSVFDVPRLCNSPSGDFNLASFLNRHTQDSVVPIEDKIRYFDTRLGYKDHSVFDAPKL